MELLIAACGNDCAACPRYTAHPYEKTEKQLRRTAELWMRIGYRDHIVTNEEISCSGCRPENWCRYRVKNCCVEKGIKTCKECTEYPCDNMKECFEVTKFFEPMCRQVCTDEEYAQLKKAFFEKEKNLSRREMFLRDYEKNDAPMIAGWIRSEEELYKWSADRFNKYPIAGNDINENYEPQLETGRFIPLTAVDDNGDVIGHFIIRYPRDDDDSSVRFGFVIIRPALRGKGYGKEMIRLGVDYVKEHLSASRIELGVFDNNENARSCYESIGFKEYAKRACEMPIGTWNCADMELFIERTEKKLETQRLILRRWEDSDAEDLYKYASDPDVGPIAGWPPHKNIDESRDVIKNVFCGKEAYAISLKEDGKAIGAIELKLNGQTDMTDRDDECELGYWLGKPFWGQGIMPEAVREMLRHAFEDCGMQKVWVGYYEGNAKSRRVQEKCGFRYQWRTENMDVPLMNEKRTGHVSMMTREDWLSEKRGQNSDNRAYCHLCE